MGYESIIIFAQIGDIINAVNTAPEVTIETLNNFVRIAFVILVIAYGKQSGFIGKLTKNHNIEVTQMRGQHAKELSTLRKSAQALITERDNTIESQHKTINALVHQKTVTTLQHADELSKIQTRLTQLSNTFSEFQTNASIATNRKREEFDTAIRQKQTIIDTMQQQLTDCEDLVSQLRSEQEINQTGQPNDTNTATDNPTNANDTPTVTDESFRPDPTGGDRRPDDGNNPNDTSGN